MQELAGGDPGLPERPGRGGAGGHQAEVLLRGRLLQRRSAVGGLTQAVRDVQVYIYTIQYSISFFFFFLTLFVHAVKEGPLSVLGFVLLYVQCTVLI